jgi:hypothetical protein
MMSFAIFFQKRISWIIIIRKEFENEKGKNKGGGGGGGEWVQFKVKLYILCWVIGTLILKVASNVFFFLNVGPKIINGNGSLVDQGKILKCSSVAHVRSSGVSFIKTWRVERLRIFYPGFIMTLNPKNSETLI